MCRFAICSALSAAIAGIAPASAQKSGPDPVAFYRSIEDDTRAYFEKTVALMNAEKDKRVKAGKVVVTPAMERDAFAGLQMITYNKAVSYGICADKFVSEKDIEKAATGVTKCIEDRNLAALKASKLTDYVNVVGAGKMAKCELKARDFKNEARFPPFDFLIGERSPQLLDFEKLSECVLEGL